jgi:starch synthase
LQEVTDLVQELRKVRDNVIWVEKHLSRPELIAILSAATVFACPSIYEPLGIVNLEAMACSIPVVATATGGIPEVVAHNETGLLVEIEQLQDGSGKPLDEKKFVSDFAAALNQMLENPRIGEFGAAGRKRVEQHFSWDSIAEQTLSVYRGAIANFK